MHEVIWDDTEEIGRFRFVAPAIGAADFDMSTIARDMRRLCRDIAVARQGEARPDWPDVVISIASAPTEFGATDPEVVQVFEGFTIDEGDCIWSRF